MDDHAVSCLGATLFQPAHDASQWFCQCSMLQRSSCRHKKGILLHNPRGDSDVLRISAIVEQQILAKILLMVPAKIACIARRRVQSTTLSPAKNFATPSPTSATTPASS